MKTTTEAVVAAVGLRFERKAHIWDVQAIAFTRRLQHAAGQYEQMGDDVIDDVLNHTPPRRPGLWLLKVIVSADGAECVSVGEWRRLTHREMNLLHEGKFARFWRPDAGTDATTKTVPCRSKETCTTCGKQGHWSPDCPETAHAERLRKEQDEARTQRAFGLPYAGTIKP